MCSPQHTHVHVRVKFTNTHVHIKTFQSCNCLAYTQQQRTNSRHHDGVIIILSALRLAHLALAGQQVLGLEVEHVTIAFAFPGVAIERHLRLLGDLANLRQCL